MAIRVWDFQENKAKTVEDSEASAGVASGRYGLRKNVELPVTSPDGEHFTVNSDDASTVFKQGYSLRQRESSQEIKDKAQRAVAEDMPGIAALKSGLSAATFGASDVAARAAGVEPSFAQALEQENPVASTVGTVVGSVAPMLAGGVIGAPTKALATAAESLGARVGAGVTAAGGTSLGAGVASRAASFGAEGAAYGFGEAVSEAALGDPNNIADSIILGGGLGGVMGGAVGVAAPIAKAVSQRMLELGEQAVVGTSEKLIAGAVKKAVAATRGPEDTAAVGALLDKRTQTGKMYVKDLVRPDFANEIDLVTADAKSMLANATEDSKMLVAENKQYFQEARDILKGSRAGAKSESAAINAKLQSMREEFKIANTEKKAMLREEIATLASEKNRLKEMAKQKVDDEVTSFANKQMEEVQKAFEGGQITLKEATDNINNTVLGPLEIKTSALYDDAINSIKTTELNPEQWTNLRGFSDTIGEVVEAVSSNPERYSSTLTAPLTEVMEKLKNTTLPNNADTAGMLMQDILNARKKIDAAIPYQKNPSLYTDTQKTLLNLRNKINTELESKLPVEGAKRYREADAAYVATRKIRSLTKDMTQAALYKGGTKERVLKESVVMNMMRDPDKRTDVNKILSMVGELADKVEPGAKDTTENLIANLNKAVDQAVAAKSAASTSKMTRTQRLEVFEQAKKDLGYDKVMAQIAAAKKTPEGLIDIPEALQASDEMAMLATQKRLIAAIEDKLTDLSISPGKAAEVVTELLGKDISSNIKKINAFREVQDHFSRNPDMGVLDKVVYLKKMMDPKKDMSYIEDIIKKNDDLSYIQQFRRNEGVSYKTDIIQPLSHVLSIAGMPYIGLPLAALGKAIDIARSPYSLLASLPVIENAAKAGRRSIESWSTGLAKALTSKPVARAVINVQNEQSNFEKRAQTLKDNADIAAFVDKTANSLQQLGSAPQVQYALMNRIQAANSYLQTQLPKDPLASQHINPAFSKWKPSAQEVAKFNRVYEAVENPRKAMDKFADGMITPEEVKAIKNVHPEIFRQMQQITMETMTSMKEPVAYEKRLSLGIMFEAPTDPTLAPEYINYMQTMIGKYAEQEKKPTSNLKFEPETLLSDSQRISMR